MPRLFMTTLGTNKYSEIRYRLGKYTSTYTPFVQEALVELLCKEWGEKDRIVVFCTKEAEKLNWVNKGDNDDAHFDRGLRDRLRDLGLRAKIEMEPIPEGKNETEIMGIFTIVNGKIEEGDNLTLDITHSFRSLPLLNTVILNYSKTLKNVTVKGIYYGAFDARKDGIAPVFDLTPYDRLLDWSIAVNEFIRYGIADRVTALVREDVSPILMEKKGKDVIAASIKRIADKLCSMSQNIRSARCFEIERFKSLRSDVDRVKEQNLIPPLNPLLDKIIEKTEGFGVESATMKGFQAARWCIEHDLLPQAYIILLETVLTGVCRELGYNPKNKKDREFLSALMSVVGQKKPESKWVGDLKLRKEEARKLFVESGEAFEELSKAYSKLGSHRNDFMHCGCRGLPGKHGTLRIKVHELYREVTLAWESFASAPTC